MKKIIFAAILLSSFTGTVTAQKVTTNDQSREIIIINNNGKEKKITIETKDGETLINGKPASEYKDDGVSIITSTHSFSAPNLSGFMFNNGSGIGGNSGFLGVTTKKENNGVKITDITKGSAAEKAGLKEDDVIIKVGDKKIIDPDELMNVITSYKGKDDVKITYERGGKQNTVTTTLGSRNTLYKSFSFDNKLYTEMFNDLKVKIPDLKALKIQPFGMYFNYGHGRLGVEIEDTENDNGVRITGVQEESNAEKAGLKKDDIITEINGKKIKDINELRKELSEIKDKNNYSLKAKRNGSDMNFEIRIPKKLNKANL